MTEHPTEHSEALPPAIDARTEEPPATESYQKARKFLAITSGVLLAWEIVGVEISESPFKDIAFKVKSPAAVAYILIALTTYGLFRAWVEWLQCDISGRRNRYARVDFAVANCIAAGALVIYAIQRARATQIFQSFSTADLSALLTATVTAYAVAALGFSERPRFLLVIAPTLCAGAWLLAYEHGWRADNPFVVVGLTTGSTFAIATGRWLRIAVWLRLIISASFRMWRIEVCHGADVLEDLRSRNDAVILATWRESRAVALYFYSQHLALKGMRVRLPVVPRRDFDILQETWRQLGIEALPVQNRAGIYLRIVLRSLRDDNARVILDLDSPRGSSGEVSETLITLAAKSQTPIVPFVFGMRTPKRRLFTTFNTLPLPFSTVYVAVGQPFQPRATDGVAQDRSDFALLLNDLARKVSERVESRAG